MSPISSRKMVPRLARLKSPGSAVFASVKAPLAWPNSSLSSSVSGMAAQLMATNGPPPAVAPGVDGAGDDLLAGAALARDEDRGVGLRHAVDEVVDLLHRGALADERVEPGSLSRLEAQALYLFAQAAVGRRAVDGDGEHVDLDGLVDEVVRARADGRDRRVEAPERGEHDDRHVGAVGDDALAELDAADAAHVEVGHDDVEVVGLERLQRLVCRTCASATSKPRLRRPMRERLAEGASSSTSRTRVVMGCSASWAGTRRRSYRGRPRSRRRSSRRARG